MIYNSANQNNNFLENYVDNKIKKIEENFSEMQNKLNNIYNGKDFVFNNRFIPQRNINKNNLPMMPSLSQRELTFLQSAKKEEKKINKNESDNLSANKSYSNFNNDAKEKYRPNKTFSNFSNLEKKKNAQILKDLNLKNEKIYKKNEIIEKDNKYKEVYKINLREKSAENIHSIFKDKKSSDIILKHKNSKVLIFNYDQKNYNNKLIPKSKLNIKRTPNRNEFMKNFSNIKTVKFENIKDSDVIDCGTGEDTSLRNIFDNLQTPKILDQRILSNKEIKMKYSKTPNPKNRINYKNVLNNSENDIHNFLMKLNKNISPQLKKNELKFKTLDNWKKNSKNKSEKNIKPNKDRVDGYNVVNLKIRTNNNINNGAKILATKKIMNSHINKNDYPNSFESLYNVQINKEYK